LLNRFRESIEQENSSVTLLSAFSEIIPDLNVKADTEMQTPIAELLNSNTIKRRVYEIDSNKKLLRKNVWNYIQKLIFKLASIANIKPTQKSNPIKHNTKKAFEEDLIKKTIAELYSRHYGLDLEQILKNVTSEDENKVSSLIQKKINLGKLKEILNKTFGEYLIEYRNSDQFMTDAEKNCGNDKRKLFFYLLLARKYKNYVNHHEKVNLDKIEDDAGISIERIRQFDEKMNNYTTTTNNNIPLFNPITEMSSPTTRAYTLEAVHNTEGVNGLNTHTQAQSNSMNIFEEFKKLSELDQENLRNKINNFMNYERHNSTEIQNIFDLGRFDEAPGNMSDLEEKIFDFSYN